MTRTTLPADLRSRLETARLDLLALLRAIDRLPLAAQELPRLKELFELDADYAEALWALDQPPRKVDQRAMLRDTLASLARMPDAQARYLSQRSPSAQQHLLSLATAIRTALALQDAYSQVPGRDPNFR
jgi:hypothetical protein